MTQVLTEDLLGQIEGQDELQQGSWVFLEISQQFPGYWEVWGLNDTFFFDLEPLVGPYRIVNYSHLSGLLDKCEALGYQCVFAEDPQPLIDEYQSLDDDPPVELTSTLEDTRKGFLPWQIEGFNRLVRRDLPATYAVWLTGSGKTALIAAAILHLWDEFDYALVVVKSHNKIDTKRKLLALGHIGSIIVEGTPAQRRATYAAIREVGKHVIVTNYEKFREDTDQLKELVQDKRILCFWDEGPTKLANRQTKLYKAVKSVLYTKYSSKPRPKWMRHWILSATPIENSPEDVYSILHLCWPKLLGTAAEFHNQYVTSYNYFSGKPHTWNRLDHLRAKLDFLAHYVSKDDPEIAKYFPHVLPISLPIDWNMRHRRIYDQLTGKAKKLLIDVEDANVLAMIQIMQMLCDGPSMIKTSAAHRERFYEMLEQTNDFTGPVGSDIALRLLEGFDPSQFDDRGHTKLEAWREIICDKHPDEKIITHSTWAAYIFPIWEHWLQQWEIPYMIYTGTDRQKQEALDEFRTNPDIRVFLSGDSGADSIDIAEAKVGVNFNVPWKWTTLQQREGRRDRVNSEFDTIYTYTLIMPSSIDERKLEICERKRQYHSAVFGSDNESMSTNVTRQDLVYMLTGDR